MKKSIAIVIIVTLVISLIAAIPVFAKSPPNGGRTVFKADIVDIPCKADTLENGEVWFKERGSYEVLVKGVTTLDPAPKTYDVYLIFETPGGPFNKKLGQITPDEDGYGILKGYITPPSLFCGARVVIIDMGLVPSPPTVLPQFASGIQITQ